ncbi:protein farnesyltransferase subunit beta isoform X1 [Zingiber officinale]|uniref:protein farnesyltransferase subunit beta isoform X1 n=1 Tax=Zingiber officinale TaxID=94328 RepID=UPI001C4B465D|nr:protein farnesyltransferase subunit beta isoform X1 [Zingiber officinale]
MRFRFRHRRIGRPNPKGNRRIPASSGEEASSVAADHSSTSPSSCPARSCSTSALMESSHPSPSPPSEQPRLTVTQIEQLRVEAKVFEIYRVLNGVDPPTMSLMLELWRDKHIEFLTKGLGNLGPSYNVLDANRPWLCYWIMHSIALLGESLDLELEENVVEFLFRCQDKNGGYGGGPGQMPHLATTYAAVNTLITLGSEKALLSIDRENLHKFFLRMKDSSGAFRMHDGGEIDVRACYTAISVASILNILDDELVKGLGNYILSCQTYEGGIAGEPSSEAHGGYTFCGLATMILINEADRLDLPSLIDWVAFRQGVECGFQGRANKLVDGCYSFWQGGSLALAQRLLPIVRQQLQLSLIGVQPSVECKTNNGFTAEEAGLDNENLSHFGFSFIQRHSECGPLFQSVALQQYILLCSQVLEGGFKDKPGKHRDFYHSCYCLSGLSLSQHSWSGDAGAAPLPGAVLGPYTNLLEPVHPLFNVVLDKYYKSHEFFSAL